MKRRLLDLLSLALLAIYAISVGLWVRSYFAPMSILYSGQPDRLQLMADRGGLQIDLQRLNSNQDDKGFHFRWRGQFVGSARGDATMADKDSVLWHPLTLIGIGAWRYIADWFIFTPVLYSWAILIPLWFIAMLTAAMPVWRAARAYRYYTRRRNGLCLVCGYDLRASPGLCPECGSTASAIRCAGKSGP